MSSDKFMKIAKDIAKKNKETFDALIQYEKTGKIRSKTRMNFTIDKSIAQNFKQYCEENGFNMSSKVEKAMNEMIE